MVGLGSRFSFWGGGNEFGEYESLPGESVLRRSVGLDDGREGFVVARVRCTRKTEFHAIRTCWSSLRGSQSDNEVVVVEDRGEFGAAAVWIFGRCVVCTET
jgi:hypothetical protein